MKRTIVMLSTGHGAVRPSLNDVGILSCMVPWRDVLSRDDAQTSTRALRSLRNVYELRRIEDATTVMGIASILHAGLACFARGGNGSGRDARCLCDISIRFGRRGRTDPKVACTPGTSLSRCALFLWLLSRPSCCAVLSGPFDIGRSTNTGDRPMRKIALLICFSLYPTCPAGTPDTSLQHECDHHSIAASSARQRWHHRLR